MSADQLEMDVEKVLYSFCNQKFQQSYENIKDEQKKMIRDVVKGVFRNIIGSKVMNKSSTTDPLIQSVLRGLGCYTSIDEVSLKQMLFMLGSKPLKVQQISKHLAVINKTKPCSSQSGFNTGWTNSVLADNNNIPSDMSKLSPISIDELVLFEIAFGKYLEGTIITPPLVFTGITTILEDQTGDYVQLGLYNLIPDVRDKWELAEMKIPKGTRIRILQPFYKIFTDGNLGIRVDSPENVIFMNKEKHKSFEDFRREGKQLVKSNDFIGALEVYLEGLKIFQEAFVLLNNRSQAYLKMRRCEEAVLDAAAVLLFEHGNEKARYRYIKGLKELGYNKQNTDRNAWNLLLAADPLIKLQSTCQNFSKESGNALFMKGTFSEAIVHYSHALGNEKNICILLNNIAIVCIKLQIYQTAIAAANACLRITTDEEYQKKARFSMTKSFSMLGENGLAKMSARKDETLKTVYEKNLDVREMLQQTFCGASMFDPPKDLLKQNKDLEIKREYINTDVLKHCYIHGKGRGLIATKDISQGEVLIVDHPVISHKQDGLFTFEIDTNSRTMNTNGHLRIKELLLRKIKHDGLLAKKLMLLECRKGGIEEDSQPLTLLKDLCAMGYLSLYLELLPFLPQSPEEIKIDRSALTPSFINDLISVNCFNWGLSDWHERKALALRISLLNHSKHANCNKFPLGDVLVVLANRTIKINEELTITYNKEGRLGSHILID